MTFIAGFSELNMVSSVAATLDAIAMMPGKKRIVLLSSGVDTSSVSNWEILQRRIETSDVRVVAVSVPADIRRANRKKNSSTSARDDRRFLREGFAQGDRSLRTLSEATGGRVYFPKDSKAFQRDYADIAKSLRAEYSLEFSPALRDGNLHSLEVKVRRPWCHVQSRQQYLAPGPS